HQQDIHSFPTRRSSDLFEDSLPTIYSKIMDDIIDFEKDERLLFNQDELTQLEMMCKEEGIDFKLVKKLLLVEKEFSGYKVRRGLDRKSTRLNSSHVKIS